MNKKIIFISGGLFFISLFVGIYWLEQSSQQKNMKNEKGIEKNKKKNKRKKDKGSQDHKTKQEKTGIDFSQYKDAYEKIMKNRWSIDGFEKGSIDDCPDKEYAILEMVFLRKTEEGEYMPVKSSGGSFQPIDDPCKSDEMGIGWPARSSKYFLIRKSDCDCYGHFHTGRKYRLSSYGFYDENNKKKIYENLNYIIDIPAAGKFEFKTGFQEPEGTEDDAVYRYPILLGDVLETKDQKQQKIAKSIKIKVHGIEQEKNQMTTQVKYHLKKRMFTADKKNESTAVISTGIRKKKDALEGELAVYGVKEADRENIKEGWLKLLQYRDKVSSTTIDLSKEPDFDHKDRNWITKKIELRPIFQEFIENHPERKEDLEKNKDEEVKLLMNTDNINRKDATGVMVYMKYPRKKDGKLTVTLSAPEGTYLLTIGDVFLKEDFDWPPK